MKPQALDWQKYRVVPHANSTSRRVGSGQTARQWFVHILVSLLFTVESCTAPPPPRPIPQPPPPAPPVPQRIDTDSILPWAVEEKIFLVVDKGCQLLRVYQHGHLVRSYPMVFSRNNGQKQYEGDKRTPVGLYMIIGKRHHPRWSRFMLLDYPTPSDVARYRHNIQLGKIPRRGGRYPGPGGEIGIHGTNHLILNEAKVNWTIGCVSLFNPDIRELYASTPEGTLVYIKE